jgi:hypothetical protein
MFLFLDVDGVLNSEAFLKTLDEAYDKGTYETEEDARRARSIWYAWKNQIDKLAIARLNRLIESVAGLQVVLSSSWRLFVGRDECEKILASHGFVGSLLDETPNLPDDPHYVKLRADGAIDRISRGHEISYWLEKRLECDQAELLRRIHTGELRIAILDDSKDMVHLTSQLVCTDAQVGVTDVDVERAIALLMH